MPEIKIIMGFPASGKTTRCKNYEAQGFIRCNRDLHGGKLIDLLKSVETQIETGNSVVLDNTYATAESRQAVINIAKKHNVPIHLEIMSTSIEEAQFNACLRAIQQYGKLLDTAELRATKNPNMFPAAVLFAYRKNLEEPTSKEGFDSITHIPFVRKDQGYTNKGIIFDYDGTLRTTKSGAKYPTSIDDIALLPNRQTVLSQIPKEYTLCGVSNQSGVAKGVMSNDTAKALFDHTNQLLEKNIDYAYCPHSPMPISCFCRKPMPGLGVAFMEKYKLDLTKTIMVGDLKSDRTFATRMGIRFVEAETFFANHIHYLP